MIFSDIAGEYGIFCDGDWIEKKDQDPNGEVRLIQLADIGAGEFLDKSNRFVSDITAERLNCTLLHAGDLLISRLGEPLCKACIFPLEGKYITAVDVAILRINNEEVDARYLLYLINSPWFKEQIKKYESGTTRKRISRKNLDRVEMQFPSVSEQRRIVFRIEELFSELDNRVSTLQKTKEQLAVYRQAVLKDAFKGNYNYEPLSAIAKAIGGYAFKSKMYSDSGKYIVVKIGNVKKQGFDFTRDLTKTTECDETILEKYLLKRGDCVISLTGSRGKRDYGFVCIIGDESNYLVNQRVAALRFDVKKALPEFYYYYLSSPLYRDDFFKYETGNVGQGNIGIKALIEPKVPVPALKEQEELVTEIESRLSVCDSIEHTVDTALQQAEAMRQSILKQAFEGRL